MMHYRKGENVEQEVTKADLPFEDCMPKGREDFLWMHVKGGTKVNNVISYAKNALEKGEYRSLVWSGSGGGVVKTVSCAEIIKRSFPLYQVTRMCYTSVEEHWKPQMEGLEEIVANRQIPSLHILMSLDPLDVPDVQKPNTKTDFWEEAPTTRRPYTGVRQQGQGNKRNRPQGQQHQQQKSNQQGQQATNQNQKKTKAHNNSKQVQQETAKSVKSAEPMDT